MNGRVNEVKTASGEASKFVAARKRHLCGGMGECK